MRVRSGMEMNDSCCKPFSFLVLLLEFWNRRRSAEVFEQRLSSRLPESVCAIAIRF